MYCYAGTPAFEGKMPAIACAAVGQPEQDQRAEYDAILFILFPTNQNSAQPH